MQIYYKIIVLFVFFFNLLVFSSHAVTFDELGGYREKYHPSVGDFAKEFNKKAFEDSLLKVTAFFKNNLTR